MSSNVIKCNSCNLVINEVLAFIQNKIDVMNEISLVRICETSFSESEIECAKNLLFDSINSEVKKKTRKRDGKTQRNLYDVIALFKVTDPDDTPVFVAKDLQKLPPISFDHIDVTRLLKDLLVIQNEIKIVKETYVNSEQLQELKNDLQNLKTASLVNNFDCTNINTTKRGTHLLHSHCLNDSGPFGLNYVPNNNEQMNESQMTTINNNEKDTLCPISVARPDYSCKITVQKVGIPKHSENGNDIDSASNLSSSACPGSAETLNAKKMPRSAAASPVPSPSVGVGGALEASVLSIVPPAAGAVVDRSKTYRSALLCNSKQNPRNVTEKNDNEWQEVPKRKKNRFTGSTGKATNPSDTRFRAADVKIPIYIYNVSKDVTENDILTYVRTKAGITVLLEKQVMKFEKEYDSYKLHIPNHKYALFMSEDFWPEGISYRKYINFRPRSTDNVNKPKNQDG